MSLITDSYKQAELALAAYSTLSFGMTNNDFIKALTDEGNGMSLAQASVGRTR